MSPAAGGAEDGVGEGVGHGVGVGVARQALLGWGMRWPPRIEAAGPAANRCES